MALLSVFGGALIAINLAGVASTRHRRRLAADYLARLAALPNADAGRYFSELSAGIHAVLEHRRSTPVSLLENWLLWLLALTGVPYFQFYEFYSPSRTLRRGFGFCSQAAILAWGVARQARFTGDVVRYDGHVVYVGREPDGKAHFVDADYGVYMALAPSQLSATPELVDQAYRDWPPERRTLLKSIYVGGHALLAGHRLRLRRWCEDTAYALKWLVPAAMATGGLI